MSNNISIIKSGVMKGSFEIVMSAIKSHNCRSTDNINIVNNMDCCCMGSYRVKVVFGKMTVT